MRALIWAPGGPRVRVRPAGSRRPRPRSTAIIALDPSASSPLNLLLPLIKLPMHTPHNPQTHRPPAAAGPADARTLKQDAAAQSVAQAAASGDGNANAQAQSFAQSVSSGNAQVSGRGRDAD